MHKKQTHLQNSKLPKPNLESRVVDVTDALIVEVVTKR